MYIVLTPCLALGHHTNADNSQPHVQHGIANSEHHSGDGHDEDSNNCNTECCCDELVAVTNVDNKLFIFSALPIWNSVDLIQLSTLHKKNDTSLARDGPIFEQAKMYSSTIAMRT